MQNKETADFFTEKMPNPRFQKQPVAAFNMFRTLNYIFLNNFEQS